MQNLRAKQEGWGSDQRPLKSELNNELDNELNNEFIIKLNYYKSFSSFGLDKPEYRTEIV